MHVSKHLMWYFFCVYGVYGVGSKQDLGYLIHAHPLQASMPGTQSTGTVVGFGLKYWMDGGEEGEAKLTCLPLRNSRGTLITGPSINKREKTRTRWAMLSANQHRPSRPYLLPLLALSLWALFTAPIKFAHLSEGSSDITISGETNIRGPSSLFFLRIPRRAACNCIKVDARETPLVHRHCLDDVTVYCSVYACFVHMFHVIFLHYLM